MKVRTYNVGKSTLTLQFGDITESTADVIVSSDDDYIGMGGGVSSAILRAGGQGILIDAAKKTPARLGDVVVTSAGSLRAKHIFHAITIGEGELSPKQVIDRTTQRSLELVGMLELNSIAFPAIGAGVAGFAYEDVAVQMAETIVSVLASSKMSLQVTIFLYDQFRPIEHLAFFEEFAARSRGLTLAPVAKKKVAKASGRRKGSKRKTSARPKRKKLVEELAKLDRERHELERRLAEYRGEVPKKEGHQLEERLNEVRKRSVDILAAVTPKRSAAVSVFLSYAHADEKLRVELGKHLSVLEKQKLIATWHDRMIGAGTEWEGVIDKRLDSAQVVLLLISADFLDSKYCYDIEMQRALERHEKRDALVIPVMLRPVSLKGTPFAKLQALPKDAKPVVTWSDRDSAFVDITEGLRTAIQSIGSGG